MKLGVFTTLLSNLPLQKALEYFKSLGIEMVEIGCGGYPGNAHADPNVLLNDSKALDEFKGLLKEYDVGLSALSCHSNPVHPNKAEAKAADEVIRNNGSLEHLYRQIAGLIEKYAKRTEETAESPETE